jgi:hypothetical protein
MLRTLVGNRFLLIEGVMPNVGDNWKCSYCGHAQVIDRKRRYEQLQTISVEGWSKGNAAYYVEAIVCANEECKKLSLAFTLCRHDGYDRNSNAKNVRPVHDWRLLPSSSAKPQPDYIPEPLRCDYEEACAIRDLSPKASATITRRCIQGVIRDFCGITKKRLIDEIKELLRLVNAGQAPPNVHADTVDAIDHVRQIGNIGAHMEADINVIVDVDPDEAQVLIELAELLFDEWYVSREQRTQRLAQLGLIAADKKQLQQQKRLPPPDGAQVEAAVIGRAAK